jgi:hypothetical protein
MASEASRNARGTPRGSGAGPARRTATLPAVSHLVWYADAEQLFIGCSSALGVASGVLGIGLLHARIIAEGGGPVVSADASFFIAKGPPKKAALLLLLYDI